MILTVTLNAALDITYRTPALVPHTTHRVSEVVERPGGKGLNVARVLAALGHETVVTGFAGGRTGDVLRELLASPALFTGTGGTGAGDGRRSGARRPWRTRRTRRTGEPFGTRRTEDRYGPRLRPLPGFRPGGRSGPRALAAGSRHGSRAHPR